MPKLPAEPTVDHEQGPVLDFLRLLWRVNHAMERRSRQMQVRLGVTAPQRMVIRLAGRFPDATASELAALLHLDPGSLSSLLARLEGAGLVNRVADRDDGRRIRVSLTRRGRRLTEDSGETVESAVTAVLDRSDPEDIRRVHAIMSALAEHLAAPKEPELPPKRRAPARSNRTDGRVR
jgi:DNA-binding MarR family transcriptional regulator